MGLIDYKKKRSFNNTPEPTGGTASEEKLHFVIQKHAASHLHYDFRLEMRGVLKSWAVPKGPSMNPADKRLAMLVEDHPYDYKDFEGIIPEGNYGAGTVIIWDEGTYEPLEPAQDKKEQEKILLKGFHAGSLKFRLHGKKLKGEFVLVKTPQRADNAWLLIKHRDRYASETDISKKDKSVVSGKTIEQLRDDEHAVEWQSNRKASSTRKTKTVKATAVKKISRLLKKKPAPKKKETDGQAILENVKGKKRSKLPSDIKPMLATLVDEPLNDQGWLYEVKWDGFRAIAYLNKGEVNIRSRNNKSFDDKFYPVYHALKEFPLSVVFDGEIVVINQQGYPDFEALQTWRSEADGQLVYYVFDLLWLEGYDLTKVPLSERKRILKSIVPESTTVRLSDTFDIEGKSFFKLADDMGLEGIVAKRADSAYTPDERSKDWLKIKTQQQQEVVIAGYTRNENSNKLFSALLMGVYEKDKLVFIGPVGTGFTKSMQEEIMKKLKPLETETCPFDEIPEYNKPSRFRPNPPKAEVTWVKPEVVGEITYRTKGGTMRHPSFKGLREDKRSRDVSREEPLPVASIEKKEKMSSLHILKPVEDTERKTLLNPSEESQVRNVDGHDLKFTNLSKVFWPEDRVTKRNMLNYYYQVAPFMLPYMLDRPQTLNRFPNGIHEESFYQKDVTGKVPSWMKTYEYFSEGDQREKHFLVCSNEASLLYIASLGCIEMNPWSSRIQKPDHPDWCIIDLDPDKNSFEQVIETARACKEVLDTLGIEGHCKTSGSTGLHIYIPLGAQYTYEESKEFGRSFVKVVHNMLPDFTSTERMTSKRKGKIYLDFLQNRPQATVAAPYSLRPKPGATVSMPLHWEEVRKGLKMQQFHIRNAIARVRSEGDLFKNVLGEGVNIVELKNKLDSILKNAE
jgi:bifunctional non-homologous end joining protein LigD